MTTYKVGFVATGTYTVDEDQVFESNDHAVHAVKVGIRDWLADGLTDTRDLDLQVHAVVTR